MNDLYLDLAASAAKIKSEYGSELLEMVQEVRRSFFMQDAKASHVNDDPDTLDQAIALRKRLKLDPNTPSLQAAETFVDGCISITKKFRIPLGDKGLERARLGYKTTVELGSVIGWIYNQSHVNKLFEDTKYNSFSDFFIKKQSELKWHWSSSWTLRSRRLAWADATLRKAFAGYVVASRVSHVFPALSLLDSTITIKDFDKKTLAQIEKEKETLRKIWVLATASVDSKWVIGQLPLKYQELVKGFVLIPKRGPSDPPEVMVAPPEVLPPLPSEVLEGGFKLRGLDPEPQPLIQCPGSKELPDCPKMFTQEQLNSVKYCDECGVSLKEVRKIILEFQDKFRQICGKKSKGDPRVSVSWPSTGS